ncbi:hypothetical protein ACHAO5_006859 [Verticillium nonalfalfae]
MQRRESRLNLRNIFGRSKTPKDVDEAPLQRELNRSGGIRNSLAEFGNWPSYKQSPRSEITPILESHPISPLVATHPPVNHDIANKQRAPASAAKPKTQPAPYKSPRGHLATWDPPPLFQAYPQAIKYAHLPAPILSADTILRHNERKGSLTIREDLTQLSPDDDPTGEKAKKHRREPSGSASKQEWTTKIYVLCTSGYLLQYSGEGHFDRLPEKMLQLSKDSAAFVSDALPGRHWVLQVSSAMDADGMTSTDSRSLFSRLPFRVTEKRSASNYLMVFEGAEDMESWIAILRREIEALGGKKNTTETGRPRMDGSFVQLKSQSSQRTLVVRDPSRFSRVVPPEFSWHANKSRSDVDSSTVIAESDAIMDPSIDDVSTTNSVTSNEGRQLDSLRDSANRLSHDWADDEDVDEVSTELPPTQTITNKDGTKTIITFRLNEQNQKVKTTRRIRYTTHTEKVNPRVAERKGWSKFGLSAKDPAGPAFDTTTVGENIIFRPSTNWRKDAKEEAKDPNAQAMKDKLKDKQVKCRICNGEHFTARCPYKDTMAPVGDSAAADVAAGMPDDVGGAAAGGAGGVKKGSYVPPALRGGPGGAAGAGERMGGKFGERDDLATLRVTNVSEMAEEQELRDMFERFGRVTRVFLAKDRETGMAKGFAFISFVDRSDAVKACAKMDGFGFKHLILRVEFAKKAT